MTAIPPCLSTTSTAVLFMKKEIRWCGLTLTASKTCLYKSLVLPFQRTRGWVSRILNGLLAVLIIVLVYLTLKLNDLNLVHFLPFLPSAKVLAYIKHNIHHTGASWNFPAACRPFEVVAEKFAPSLTQLGGQSILIASILHNSAGILHSNSEALIQAISIIKTHNITVHISIYENGSKDRTKAMLRRLDTFLAEMAIPRSIVLEDRKIKWSQVHRIAVLADLRNQALSPLWDQLRNLAKSSNGSAVGTPSSVFDNVIFINDVVLCAEDILELIIQHMLVQKAHISCAVDIWNLNYYDTWVARNIKGGHHYFRMTNDVTTPYWNSLNDAQSSPHFDRENLLLPYQMFTCWGGMAMFVTEPLIRHHIRFRSQNVSSTECGASECFYIGKDFWLHGYRRVVTLPHVLTSYVVSSYTQARRLMNARIAYLGDKRPSDNSFPAKDGGETMAIQKWVSRPPSHFFCVNLDDKGVHDADWAHTHYVSAETEGFNPNGNYISYLH